MTIARIDPRRMKALEKLGLATVEDLLDHYPRRHEDRRAFLPIAALRTGVAVTVAGNIARIGERRTRRGWSMVEAEIADSSGILSAVWFHAPWLKDLLRPGARIFLYGEVGVSPLARRGGRSRHALQMVAPEFELDAAEADEEAPRSEVSLHLGRLVPIYPTSKGITQRWLRRLVDAALACGIPERSRDAIYRAFEPGAAPRAAALRDLHFPGDEEALRQARDRLAGEEYFLFATRVLRRREEFRGGGGPAFGIAPELEKKIRSVFPFRLTPDQDRAVAEICADLRGPAPMYRLLQGDVGTGKTAVALFALLAAVRNRYQGALMAPTEVLAEQHHRTISGYLARHPKVRIALLTGSLGAAEKRRVQEGISRGDYHLAIGTHALIQEAVRFRNLGLVVIDEQHRFGVRERAALRKKGSSPHLLVMTATPIPRSLCLTAYGDLDLSLLTARPPGRRPVKTILVPARKRPGAMEFIRGEIGKGRQAYFVYPLIDESEALVVPAAVEAHQRLSSQVFPGVPIGLLHGRMPAKEKEERLRRFREGLDRVLVATVVVEVGIDVPNATVLFLEDSSRFGLAQLHQLRGRIGRGTHQSYCLVSASGSGRDVLDRLRAFAATEDGFRIAEEDLRLRGPGDFLGVRQTGWPDFVLGNPLKDLDRFLALRDRTRKFWEDPRSRARFPDWGLGAEPSGDFLGLD